MRPYRHGLVIGKFYPPHAGHHHLIDVAAAHCERVSVIVMASTVETIALSDRVAWLRTEHQVNRHQPHVSVLAVTDDHEVDYDSPAVWDQHVALMDATLARDAIGRGDPADAASIDVVFTSEAYGAELARRYRAAHVLVDIDRNAHPTSGTAARADLVQRWDDLAAPTKAGLALRVVVLGAESTGTTTTARLLTQALRERGGVWAKTRWVREYGRDYTLGLLEAAAALAAKREQPAPGMDDLVWAPEDFEHIARTQLDMEDVAAGSGSPVLVCDTDAFTTSLWQERYTGAVTPAVAAVGDARRHDLYLLTDPTGVPFEQDGTRDGEHLREWMHDRFVAALRGEPRQVAPGVVASVERPFTVLTGTREQRLAQALEAVDGLLAGAFVFADPLG